MTASYAKYIKPKKKKLNVTSNIAYDCLARFSLAKSPGVSTQK